MASNFVAVFSFFVVILLFAEGKFIQGTYQWKGPEKTPNVNSFSLLECAMKSLDKNEGKTYPSVNVNGEECIRSLEEKDNSFVRMQPVVKQVCNFLHEFEYLS